MLQSAWGWFVSHLETIKDIFWILFTLTTTVIAVLTYQRAKKTLLQPLRSEVIKRQTDTLVQLLDFLDGKDTEIYELIDYAGIIYCNLYMFAEACGFFTEVKDMEDEQFKQTMQDHIEGFIITKKDSSLASTAPHSPFEYPHRQSEKEKEQKQQERRVLYKNGVFDNEHLLLTKEFQQYKKEMDDFAHSPFVPSKIQKLLMDMQADVYYNITIYLQDEVHSFMQEMCSRMSKLTENKPIQFNPSAVIGNFFRVCKKHDATISQIRKCIREYLMIDSKWN